MQIQIFAALYNVLPIIYAQIDIINEDLGDLQLYANVGILPAKYTPLTKTDQKASDKALDFVDFIQLVPNFDPMRRAQLAPVGIDVPYLWFKGTAYFKNVLVSGVKQLVVNSVELRMKNLRIDLNVTVPNIHFEGDFNLQSTISFLSLIARCHISADLMDVNVLVSSGSRTVNQPPIGEVLQLDSASIQIDIKNIRYNVTKVILGGEEEFIGGGAPITQLFHAGRSGDNIYDGLLHTALQIANRELLKVSTDVFKSYLFPELYHL